MPPIAKPQAKRLRHVVSVRLNDHEKKVLKQYTRGRAARVSDMLRIVLEDWIQQRDLRQAA